MAYQQVKDILGAIRKFHARMRQELESAQFSASDPRTAFLLKAFRQQEIEMDAALAKYDRLDHGAVLETWIQYVPTEEVEIALRSRELPPHATPDLVLEWKQQFDTALAAFYRQLADQVMAPRAEDLLESLAIMTEKRIADESWQAREDELAPDQ